MEWNEATEIINAAKSTAENGDRVVREVAILCEGRLEMARVQGSTLAKLKHELRQFNTHTKKWK